MATPTPPTPGITLQYRDGPRYLCVSDAYDPDGTVPYEDVQDFLDVCQSCFGSEPVLREQGGCYYDESNTLVLEPLSK